MSEPTALGLSARTGAIMVGFSVVFTAVMAFTHDATEATIEASAKAEKLKLVSEVLPPDSYNNDLIADRLSLGPTPALGLEEGGQVYRARKDGQDVALVLEAAAPDGYSGRIDLIIALHADGSLGGVRAVAHRETPGLGDYIDPRKDKDKQHPWITQFTHLNPSQLPLEQWKVRKDGGQIAYHTGATISARAVTNAVARATAYAQEHQAELFAPRGDARP